MRQEQLQERLGERFRELDVPLLVEWPDGRREALLFVLEEESDPSRFSIHRLLHYCVDLAELFETDRVVPVVIFLRGTAPRYRLELGGERHRFLDFTYLACELATLPYEDYRNSDNIVARVNLPNMCFAPEQKLDSYARAARGLFELEQDPEKRLKYIDFIDIYACLDDNERARYQHEYPNEAEIMSSFAERFIQQGREQGREQGRAEGLEQGAQRGESAMLTRLLQLKFGSLPEAVREKIEGADAQTLLGWSERVLIANCLEDVFAP